MSTSTAPSVRCPRCSAHLRAGSQWCSLCYTDLRPAPAPVLAPPVLAPPVLAPPVGAPARPVRPRGKHARRGSSYDDLAGPSPDDVDVLARAMLAELAATERTDPLGSLGRLVDSTPKKVGLMVGGAVAAMTLLFVVMAVLGALF